MIVVGTEHGLLALDGPQPHPLIERDITAMSARDDALWVLADRTEVLRGPSFEPVAKLDDERGNCILASRHGVFVGTERARLVHVDGGAEHVAGFDAIDGRQDWYTPWGGPPDVRSMTETADGTLLVNVHVGGIARSRDGGTSWEQTIDIDADIHQVLAHADRTFAPGAFALHISGDAGDTWTEHTAGFAVTYMRAVAVAGGTVLVSAAAGHAGGRSGIWRRALDEDGPFERCDLPDPVSKHNVDTRWLAGDAERAVFVTAEGDAFASTDEGRSWDVIARGLPAPRCVAITQV